MERDELHRLLVDTDAFIAAIFDAVAPMSCVDFLHQVYSFRAAVERKIMEANNV